MEFEDREPDQTLLGWLETCASCALGPNWGVALDTELVANLGRWVGVGPGLEGVGCARSLAALVPRQATLHARCAPPC
jgi:hypothetical protein